jgi:hypothetical protein
VGHLHVEKLAQQARHEIGPISNQLEDAFVEE